MRVMARARTDRSRGRMRGMGRMMAVAARNAK